MRILHAATTSLARTALRTTITDCDCNQQSLEMSDYIPLYQIACLCHVKHPPRQEHKIQQVGHAYHAFVAFARLHASCMHGHACVAMRDQGLPRAYMHGL